MELSVTESAQQLGLSRQRILALISDGSLPARQVGGHWILDAADLEARARDMPQARPMAATSAWGIVALLEGEPAGWLKPDQRSRLQSRLRLRPPVDQVVGWVRRRSEVLHLKAHPAALPRLLAVPGALPAGVSAGGHDLIHQGRVEVYLPKEQADQAVRHLALKPVRSRDANAAIRIPQQVWPFDARVGPVAVAFDLWEDSDERSRRTARQLYQHALDERFPEVAEV